MKAFRVTYKSKDGSFQYVTLLAADKADAEKQAAEYQARRHSRFDLTFARLEQAKETGDTGMLAVAPGQTVTEAFVKAETERRKRDRARYDNDDLKVVKVEEVK